jgi:DNA-binding NtrC family response regulator
MNQPQSQPAKARVLFVDDEPRILTTMRMLFRNHYEVYFAESGHKALAMLKMQPVDVIVSDQRMPGMTGIELLRTARDLNPNAMRILLTGYSDLNAIIGSINEGEIFRFVNKPWSNEDLSLTVARAVAAAHTSAAASAAAGDALAHPPGPPPGVLVLDDDPAMPQNVQAILGEDYRVFGATTMEEAVGLMERERIGVVLSDTRVQDHPVLNLLGTLKQHHPELVSVILTDRADAGQAIELINQGQIYRFITKPIHDNQCKITVNSALKQHERLAQNPQLHKRYAVEAPVHAPAAASGGKFLDRIRSLRSWVSKRA